jgi:sugar (pentulose or hexulose) kinase
MICWNDQTLAQYHAEGQARLGGPARVQELIGGPWAVRYSLSHLVKDEHTLSEADWYRTWKMLPHGPASAGYLTGRFDCTSVSSAASTGLMDFRSNQWCRGMLNALSDPTHREQAWQNLPTIIEMNQPIGPLSESIALDAQLPPGVRPLVFPTLDDQAAGLVGGGAVDAGQVAIILGNSAVVNSSAATAPRSGSLDAMKLNWGPYLWMRCYTNGAQFLDRVVGEKPDWTALEAAARAVAAGCAGVSVLPFLFSEPSIGLQAKRYAWTPNEPSEPGVRLRASFEALAYLIGLAVQEHEAAGQSITRVTVSGGIAKNDLMLEILASVLNRELVRLVSSEGPALGAAVTAWAGYVTHCRQQTGDSTPFTVAEAVREMVKFRPNTVKPRSDWASVYAQGLANFRTAVKS